MLLVSDVHGEFEALRDLVELGQPLLILGDLVNFIDYRTYEGILADVLGVGVVQEMVACRTRGDYEGSRRLWNSATQGRRDEVRREIGKLVEQQYSALATVLEGGRAFVTFGNVDRPELLRQCLPAGSRFMDGEAAEIEGLRVGFVGGGAPSPLGVPGEVPDTEIRAKLSALGQVDVLCTHMAPTIRPLRLDVVTGSEQRSSSAILDYILEHQPAFHFFGDVHQPQATRWRLGSTTSVNVGYFRATRRATVYPAA